MKKRTALKISIFVLAALIVISSAVVIYAYFLTRPVVFNSDGTEQYATLGMEISLLFDKLDSSLDGTELPITGTDGEAFSFDPDATWGTAENPYIISDVRHLYNLSALQPIGYFKSVFGSPLDSSNPAQTTLTADDLDDGTKIPYFLVCNTDGTPVTIDGSDMTIAPIGTYDNPFIGYIGGAFVEGTTTVNGKASSVSAIDGVTVCSTEDVVDVGLFGHIGYIGSESDSFYAITTTIRDLLISDVKIEVRNPTPWEAVSSAVHRFTYSLLSGDDQAQAAHENHHVGIFAGHAEYATLEYISVYYSSDDITAIDISHTSTSSDSETANYSSVSGILGFIYNINPEINDNGSVAGGSGTSNADLISAGISSGGGLLSGVGRGYLDAATIYGKYAVASGGDGTQTRDRGQIIWEYYKTADSINKTYGPMVTKMPNGSYRLQNAEDTLSSISVANGVLTIDSSTWSEFIIQVAAAIPDTEPTEYTYTYYNGPTYASSHAEIYQFNEVPMTIFNATSVDDGSELCTEWLRPRLIGFLPDDPTGKYYFYDGVFTFALSSEEDLIVDTWENNTADVFNVGDDSDSAWQLNTNIASAIALYTKPITNNEELDEAIAAGKKLFVTFDVPDTNQSETSNEVFAMTLQDQSTAGSGTPDVKYSTPGTLLTFDSQLSDDLYYAYENGAITRLPDGISETSIESLMDNWDDYRIINVGELQGSQTLASLKARYQITAQAQSDKLFYFRNSDGSNGTPATVTNGTVEEFYTFSGGYIYYTTESYSWGITSSTGYTYYFCDSSGGTTKISADSGRLNLQAPDDTLKNYTTMYGERYYTYTYNNVTYNGPLINTSASTFYSTGNSCNINSSNGTVTKSAGSAHPIVIFENGRSDLMYLQTVSEATAVSQIEYTGNSDATNIPLYRALVGETWTESCMIVNRYSTYNFGYSDSSGTVTNYLNLLDLYYTNALGVKLGEYYALWNGTDAARNTASNFAYTFNAITGSRTPTVTYSKLGTIIFNQNGTGDCYIGYTLGATTRYVGYSSSTFISETTYNWDNSTSPYTTMRIYSVEATQTVGGTRIRFLPNSQSSADYRLSCDEYVLWPDDTFSGSEVFNTNGDQTANPSSSFSVFNIDNLGWTNDSEGNPVQLMWKNSLGQKLSYSDLHNKFTLAEGMEFGVNINIFGGTWDVGGDTMLRAPVGSNGEEANIPLGGIAFRVNREGDNKIRVVVAVPTTMLYPDEDVGNTGLVNLDYENNYYFGLWHYSDAGSSTVETFRNSDALELFNLPRSHTYAPGSSAGASEYISVRYDTNGDGVISGSDETDLRTYLNGDRVLIAYEFSVDESGIYILGSANSALEIVYFSADGTASAGRDGSGGSRLGKIDFVYDYNGSVVPVQDYDTAPPSDEDYDYYYATLCLLFTNNTKSTDIPLNDLNISVERRISGSPEHSVLNVTATSDNSSTQPPYVKCVRYSPIGDTVNLDNTG